MYRLSNSSFKSKLLCRVAYSESKLFFPLSRRYTIIRSYLQSGFLPCYSVYYSVIHVLSQRSWNFSFHAADNMNIHVSLILHYLVLALFLSAFQQPASWNMLFLV